MIWPALGVWPFGRFVRVLFVRLRMRSAVVILRTKRLPRVVDLVEARSSAWGIESRARKASTAHAVATFKYSQGRVEDSTIRGPGRC